MKEFVIQYLFIFKAGARVIDFFLLPFILPAALLLKLVRFIGIDKIPLCRELLLRLGIFPIINHYYEPRFDYRQLIQPLDYDRNLTGIRWQIEKQLAFLQKLEYASELQEISLNRTKEIEYYINNRKFEGGDGECWYQMIRHFKPQRIFEIGSGFSTLMAIKAIRANLAANSNYHCQHICIEPYEMKWLEKTGIEVIRKRIEEFDLTFFTELQANDILFIDSSHIIRPQGDVLYEYLEILPILNRGVIVHIHDIFSPKNYRTNWLIEQVRFWNEQYLLEAFLSCNSEWEILLSVNHIKHHHYEALKTVAPYLQSKDEPGSFYLRKIQ
jgi:hypothetical protein